MAREAFCLRLRGTDRTWVRRGLFAELAWRTVAVFELASEFESRGEAEDFAKRYRIVQEAELVTVTFEALHPAAPPLKEREAT